MSLYVIEHLNKAVQGPSEQLVILKDINMTLPAGESIAILGASGSGKSTLLHIMGTLDSPTSGKIFLDGQDLNLLAPEEKARLRNKKIGFVFQFHHLLPEFNTLENIAMQAIVGGMPRGKAMRLAAEALEKVGLAERGQHNVTTLSGGERQRAAIARAILLSPRVLLADEPTGNLDGKTGEMVVSLLHELNRSQGMTLVMVTHNREIAAQMQHSFELRSGELYEQSHV